MKKIWKLLPPSPTAAILANEAGISHLIAQLLINRGIKDIESFRAFLSPRLSDLEDPMLLRDMDAAVESIIYAITNKEQIAIFGDYDADGLTATALLLNLFSELDVPVSFYIPNRLKEGYSLNSSAIRQLADKGVRLIITVDCGISNANEIRLAKELGMKVVVTDHHQMPEDFQPFCPVINPNRPDSSFPFRQLSGVGVTFFLSIALRAALRDSGWFSEIQEPDLRQYLDLVALGTVADMVPLTDQNRILVRSGIETMIDSRWPGLNVLKQVSGIDQGKITSYDLAFRLAPRLNAPGRMGDITTALKALTTDRYHTAQEAAEQLNRINSQRQSIESEIVDEIEETMIPEYDLESRRVLILAKKGWHKGVLGIVASKLLNKYHRPTLILTIENGIASGSGRSIDGMNLHKALSGMSHLFKKFGGHYHAVGCTLDAANIKILETGLEEIARDKLSDKDLIPSINVDMEISFQDLTMHSIKEITTLAPFGSGNPEPVFYTGSIEVLSSRIVGERHLKLTVRKEGKIFDTIGFNLSDRHPLDGRQVNMVFTPQIDSWRGNEKIQLRINDLELADGETRLLISPYTP